MTAAMFEEQFSTGDEGRHCPTTLREGTLVHLWRPWERPWHDGNRPVLARVERTTVHNITAVDLHDSARCIYEVVGELPGHLWQWEVAAAPQSPTCVGSGIEIIDAPPTLEDRTRMVVGDVGEVLKVSLKNGEIVHGTLTKLVMGQDAWEAEWAEVVDTPPGRDTAVHAIRVADVSKVTRFRRA